MLRSFWTFIFGAGQLDCLDSGLLGCLLWCHVFIATGRLGDKAIQHMPHRPAPPQYLQGFQLNHRVKPQSSSRGFMQFQKTNYRLSNQRLYHQKILNNIEKNKGHQEEVEWQPQRQHNQPTDRWQANQASKQPSRQTDAQTDGQTDPLTHSPTHSVTTISCL